MDAHAAARAWVEAWEAAWPAKDVDRISSRYRSDAPYHSQPFRDVSSAREYVTRAFGEEELVRCWFGEPIVDAGRAAVEYWAILRSPHGANVTIAGTAVLRFDEEGLVTGHWDYWDQRDGVAEPSAGWGA